MRFLMLNWRDPCNPMAGGAERVTQGYWDALAERGHEVWWWSCAFPGARREEQIGAIHLVRGGGVGTSVWLARRWYQAQGKNFDLVVDQHHGLPWFAPWWAGTRCVAYLHEVLGPIWGAFYPWPLSWIGRVQERWMHRLYRDISYWTGCQGTKTDLIALGVRKVEVIPYGVGTRPLEELPEKRMASPLELIAVSRLAPNKRIDHAIRAVHVLKGWNLRARLTIVGGGECEAALKRLANELGLADEIVFAGVIKEHEKEAALRSAHLLLHTSQREGWGLNVIEANAMGTPAAVYPVRGLTESTLHRETGWVSTDETPESLAQGVRVLLDDPALYAACRQAAWRRAGQFHWDRVLPGACDWLEEQARRGLGSRRGN